MTPSPQQARRLPAHVSGAGNTGHVFVSLLANLVECLLKEPARAWLWGAVPASLGPGQGQPQH